MCSPPSPDFWTNSQRPAVVFSANRKQCRYRIPLDGVPKISKAVIRMFLITFQRTWQYEAKRLAFILPVCCRQNKVLHAWIQF